MMYSEQFFTVSLAEESGALLFTLNFYLQLSFSQIQMHVFKAEDLPITSFNTDFCPTV